MKRISLPFLVAVAMVFAASCHKKAEQVKPEPKPEAKKVEKAKAPEQKVKKEVKKAEAKADKVKEVKKEETVTFELSLDGLETAPAIENRMPKDPTEQFLIPKGQESTTVVTWCRVLGAKGETSVKHVYYLNGVKVDEITLRVASPNWRTWSRKNIKAEHAGQWKVEVVDPNGKVLGEKTFTVSVEE